MKVEGRRWNSHVSLGSHGAADQHLKTNREQAVITRGPKGGKNNPQFAGLFLSTLQKAGY